MAQMWEPAKEPKHIARAMIQDRYQHLSNTRIEYLYALEPIKDGKREAYAKTSLLSAKNAYCYWLGIARQRLMGDLEDHLDVDAFPPKIIVIEFCKKTWVQMNPLQRRAVVEHELLHCDTDEHGQACLRPHDVEEFRAIVTRYGPTIFADVEQFMHAMKRQMPLLPMMEEAVPNDETMTATVTYATFDGQEVTLSRVDAVKIWRMLDEKLANAAPQEADDEPVNVSEIVRQTVEQINATKPKFGNVTLTAKTSAGH